MPYTPLVVMISPTVDSHASNAIQIQQTALPQCHYGSHQRSSLGFLQASQPLLELRLLPRSNGDGEAMAQWQWHQQPAEQTN